MRLKILAVMVALLLGAQAGVFAETVYFQDDFTGPDLDPAKWDAAHNYLVADGRLGLEASGYAFSDPVSFGGAQSGFTFSGQWGSAQREMEMTLYNSANNPGVSVFYQYVYSDGQMLPTLKILDRINNNFQLQERIGLPAVMTDFSMNFYGNGWNFASGDRTWSLGVNPLNGTSGVSLKLYAGSTGDTASNAYFSNLKICSLSSVPPSPVVPEPLSAGLFLLGGAVLALRRKSRRFS